MKRKIIIAFAGIILVVSGISFFFIEKSEKNHHVLTLYGNVDIRDANLGFRVSGKIQELKFEEGDRVKKGDVMAILDKAPFEANLAIAKSEMIRIEAKLAEAEVVYRRRAKLVKTNSVSQEEFDNAKYTRDQELGEVARTKALIEKYEIELNDTKLIAPNDGTVLTRVCEAGTVVGQGAVVYTIALDTPVWVRTYVNEPDLGSVYPGQAATVLTDSGGKYTGQIGFISPQAEFTPKNVETRQLRTDLVYRLRVIIDKPDEGLRQGMPVTVNIQEGQRSVVGGRRSEVRGRWSEVRGQRSVVGSQRSEVRGRK